MSRRSTAITLGVICLLTGLVMWLRWPTLGAAPWNVDEAIHAAAARTLLDGGVLYRDAIDQRTPLSYYAVAACFSLFGENNLWAVRFGIALLVTLSGIWLFIAGRALRGSLAGIAAGSVFCLLASTALFQGDANAANTEWFLACFTSAGIALIVTVKGLPRPGRSFAIGGLFGFAFLSKQPALLEVAVPMIFFAAYAWSARVAPRQLGASMLFYLAGWITPTALTMAYFWWHDALADAVFYTWTYNVQYYGPEISAADRVVALLHPLALLRGALPVLFVAWGIGAVLVIHRLLQRQPTNEERNGNPSLLLVAAWTLTAWAGAASSGRDFDHYTIQLLAPFALGVGLTVAAWMGRLRQASINPLWKIATWVLLLLVIGHAGWSAIVKRQRTLPPDPSVRVANYIRAHSKPTDSVFVWGFHPDIYLQANRRAASRFLYGNFLTGMIPWTNVAPDVDTHYAIVPGSMEQLLADLEKHTPLFIVDCSVGPNRHWDKYPPENYPEFNAYLRQHYRQIAGEQFVPQGFRLYRRATTEELTASSSNDLPATTITQLKIGVLRDFAAPLSARAPYGADITMQNGHMEYFMHAPSAITYQLSGAAHVFRGGFGIRAAAYAPDHNSPTDGAEFIISWQPVGGQPQVLFRRLLNPLTIPSDRGTQSFHVTLPEPATAGTLQLEINPGPAENYASDWTYWSDLMLENSH